MSGLKVTVEGAGGHGYEFEVIRRALEAAGVTVLLGRGADDCNTIRDWRSIDSDMVLDERDRMKRMGYQRTVVLQAVHVPWGG